MENMKVTRSWGWAAALIVIVAGLAVAAMLLIIPARAQQTQVCCPAVLVQWQPQSILETKFRARVIDDSVKIVKALREIASNPKIGEEEFTALIEKTYFSTPRLYTDVGWVEGVSKVLAQLKQIIKPGSQPAITSLSVMVEYEPYAGVADPAKDVDASAKVVFTFSASPGENQGGGTLRHSRICEII
jgi:hypothetical protein